jgi:hypothetical protein
MKEVGTISVAEAGPSFRRNALVCVRTVGASTIAPHSSSPPRTDKRPSAVVQGSLGRYCSIGVASPYTLKHRTDSQARGSGFPSAQCSSSIQLSPSTLRPASMASSCWPRGAHYDEIDAEPAPHPLDGLSPRQVIRRAQRAAL